MSVGKSYLFIGLALFALTFALYFDAVMGPRRRIVDDIYVLPSKLEVFLSVLPWLLALSALGCALGLVQDSIALPVRLGHLGSVGFGLGVLLWAFLGYLRFWRISRTLEPASEQAITWLGFLGGAVLLLCLLMNLVGLFRSVKDPKVCEKRDHILARRIYVAGALGMAAGIVFLTWYGHWPWEESLSESLHRMVVVTVIHPAIVGLGVAGLLLGWLQEWTAIRPPTDWALAGAYLVGVAILIFGLSEAITIEYYGTLKVGLVLVCTVIAANLVSVGFYHSSLGET